jgi:hypothetical protein
MELLEKQEYKCALSGEVLTCNLEVGTRTKTNASLDRIQAGGEYTIDNVQFVCAVINQLRMNMSVEEFVEWCRKVVDHAVQK